MYDKKLNMKVNEAENLDDFKLSLGSLEIPLISPEEQNNPERLNGMSKLREHHMMISYSKSITHSLNHPNKTLENR